MSNRPWSEPILRIIVQGIVLLAVIASATFLAYEDSFNPAVASILTACGTTAGTVAAVAAVTAAKNGNGQAS